MQCLLLPVRNGEASNGRLLGGAHPCSRQAAVQLIDDRRVSEMAVQKLSVVWEKRYLCPRCQQKLRYVPGDAVAIVDGRVDMTRTQPYYVCDKCHTSYRELMGSGYFEEYEGVDARLPAADAPADAGQAAAPERRPAKPKHPLRSTGELEPVQLKREADGRCACPRCGERMDFVEGQPVRIVDGKPDMENVMDHFRCSYCGSVFRRIATTDYFKWSER